MEPDSALRMTDAEALMWMLEEADPSLSSAFVSLTFLDRSPDLEHLEKRILSAAGDIPGLTHRVRGLRWEPDPDFSSEHHLRHLHAPHLSSRADILELASLAADVPLDSDRPLWEFTVVDGLDGGETALIVKMHHVLSDGVGAVHMSASFLDLSARGDPMPTGSARRVTNDPIPMASVAHAAPSTFGAGARRVAETASSIGHLAVRLPAHVLEMPGVGARAAVTTANLARSAARQLAIVDAAHSPLWKTRDGRTHRFETLDIDLADLKSAASRLGGTVNDVFVTVVAGAAGAYHRARQADIGELRMSMPVSTRTDHSAAGNAWAPTRVLVPVGGDLRERFSLVHERLEAAKREPALGLVGPLATLVRRLPSPLVLRLARQQVGTVDFACSNVRGAPFDLWVAGARVLATYAMGPTAGTAFNATILSYRHQVGLGLSVDTSAVDDAPALGAAIADELEAVLTRTPRHGHARF